MIELHRELYVALPFRTVDQAVIEVQAHVRGIQNARVGVAWFSQMLETSIGFLCRSVRVCLNDNIYIGAGFETSHRLHSWTHEPDLAHA
jgi:hypothetical protein